MPTVPRVSGPSVGQDILPGNTINVRATADDFGAGAYEALGRLGQRVGGIIQNEEEKNDMAQVMDARNALHTWENDWFDPANDKGVRSYQGKDALGLQTAIGNSYKQRVAELTQGLANPKQRQAFTTMAGQFGEQVRSKVNTYAYAENQKYQADTFRASLASSSEIAANAARDGQWERAQQEMALAGTLIDQNARLTGEPPEVVLERKRALLSQTTLAGVNGMLSSGRTGEAETFWRDNADQMSFKDRTDGAKAIVLGRIQANPQATANALSMSVPAAPTAGMPTSPVAQIRADAAAAGVSPITALAISDIESGIRPNAKNPKSSAGGLFQLIDSSWEQYSGGAPRGDVAAQSKAGIAYIADSQRTLRGALGRQPEPHELYMAHLFGQAGAQLILKADDSRPIVDVVRIYAPRQADGIVQNNGMAGLTVGQVKDKWRQRMARSLALVSQIPEHAPPQPGEDDARRGELGTLHNPDGSVSTEISITVTDPSLNGGRPTNIPLLVRGQQGVEDLQAGADPTDEQQGIAIRRAVERVKNGSSLPSFDTIEQAAAAAAERSDSKGRALDDPIIAALPIENRIQLQSAAESEARQLQSQSRAGLQVQVQDAVAAFSRGEQPQKPLTYDQFAAAYSPTEAAREFGEYRSWQQFGSDVGQIKTMPAGDLPQWLEARKPAPGSENYADAAKRYDALVTAAAHVQKVRQEDPIQAAITAGGTAVTALDMRNPQSLPDQLALRVAGAQQVSTAYGTPLQVFSKAEAQQLSQSLRTMPSQQKVEFMQSLRAGVTDPRAFGAAMGQIAPDQPVLAVAGSIMQKQKALTVPGGWFSPNTELRQSDVAALMIEGDSLLNPQAADKKEDGRAKSFPMPAGAEERDMRDQFDKETGTAFAGLPNGYQLTYQAARAYYAAQMARKGDFSGRYDGAKWGEAIKAATGGVTNYNDRGEVLLPWGMPEDQFDGAAQTAFARALQLRGMPAGQLSDYGLQSLSDSRYLVTTGTGWLRGPDGQKVVIDLSAGP